MTTEQLANIKRLTDHSYEEIMEMGETDFFWKITKLWGKGVLSKLQHDWLIKERKNYTKGNISIRDLQELGFLDNS